jgi:hypothetical protein
MQWGGTLDSKNKHDANIVTTNTHCVIVILLYSLLFLGPT